MWDMTSVNSQTENICFSGAAERAVCLVDGIFLDGRLKVFVFEAPGTDTALA